MSGRTTPTSRRQSFSPEVGGKSPPGETGDARSVHSHSPSQPARPEEPRSVYVGPGVNHPRKYVQGPLCKAYARNFVRNPKKEYIRTCATLGGEPNSDILKRLVGTGPSTIIPSSQLLGGLSVSLKDTYVGERGFIALLPLLDMNTRWTELDASNNGLRNEAVLHLVDMLMQPQHAERIIKLDLSKNPISETAARALTVLARSNPYVQKIDLSFTRASRRTIVLLRQELEDANERMYEEKCAHWQTDRASKIRVSQDKWSTESEKLSNSVTDFGWQQRSRSPASQSEEYHEFEEGRRKGNSMGYVSKSPSPPREAMARTNQGRSSRTPSPFQTSKEPFTSWSPFPQDGRVSPGSGKLPETLYQPVPEPESPSHWPPPKVPSVEEEGEDEVGGEEGTDKIVEYGYDEGWSPT
eukprot:TRINITY_DN62864_c0_g1_i1.p1 TRINITY_DN62864_c0_g1~~TRINITY_DN62864_c0_g1_i1.p1  ORF type:complete len:411 (+),score=42.69 TRINITY_DN62864_c0_g1_i1:250-1482(+)